MGLLDRAGQIFKAKVSHGLDAAENPNETLDYSYEQMQDQLNNFRRSIVDVTTAKKRLELEEEGLQQSLVKLDTQSRQAVAAGRDDLAKQALTRKAGVQAQLQDIDKHVQDLATQQSALEAKSQDLQVKVENFRTEKEVMKANYSAAEAQVKIGESASGISKSFADTGAAIERARDKTEQMTARAAAINELVDSGTLDDALAGGKTSLDRELEQVTQSSQVDAELASLKAEIGQGAAQPALEGGAAPAASATPSE